MRKSAYIRARIEPNLKNAAEDVFRKLGLTATDAITMFYSQVSMREGIPFSLNVPNKETAKSLSESLRGEDLVAFDNMDDLLKELQS